MNRRSLLPILLPIACAALPAPFAPSAEADTEVSIPVTHALIVTGGVLAREDIKITHLGTSVQVDELDLNGPRLDPGSGCSRVATRRVTCHSGFDRVRVELLGLSDSLQVAGPMPPILGIGGLGDDRFDGGPGKDEFMGDDGDDVLEGGEGTGTGNDTLRGGDGDDILAGRDGRDDMFGEDDRDTIFARDGVADGLIACGNGSSDFADIDLKDTSANGTSITACETVQQGAIREGPNVRISRRPVRLTRAGDAPVRLACPRPLPSPCTGRLRLRGRGVALGSRRYRVAPGKTKAVRVRLSARGRRLVGRSGRLRVKATAVERGTFGPKTTITTLRLKR